MKKVIFVWAVMLAVSFCLGDNFSLPTKVYADNSTIDYQLEAVNFFCDENAELAQTLDEVVGINVISFGSEVIITPTSHFFLLVKEMIMAEERQKDYKAILFELYKDNSRLKLALKQRTFMAERIK